MSKCHFSSIKFYIVQKLIVKTYIFICFFSLLLVRFASRMIKVFTKIQVHHCCCMPCIDSLLVSKII